AFNGARLCSDSGISRTHRRILDSRAAVPLRGKAPLDVGFHCSGCRNARSDLVAEYDSRLEDRQVQFPTALGRSRARLLLCVTCHCDAKERTWTVAGNSFHFFQDDVTQDFERLGCTAVRAASHYYFTTTWASIGGTITRGNGRTVAREARPRRNGPPPFFWGLSKGALALVAGP